MTAIGDFTLNRKNGWLIILVLCVGSILRLWGLGEAGFNSDEAVYAGQAAVLFGHEQLREHFSIFRAHPLLFQFIVSNVYSFSFGDVQARVVSVIFSIATIFATYLLGSLVCSRNTGLVASSLLALMPYSVIVSRQAILDVPLTFFSVISIFFLARFLTENGQRWLHLAGVSIGLATLSKEVGILLLPVVLIATVWARMLSLRNLCISFALFAVTVLPYPVSMLLNQPFSISNSYFLWQLSRPPNHLPTYFLDILIQYAGYLFLAVAAIGALFLIRRRNRVASVLLLGLFIPLGFLQLWPVKLFPYLLPIIPVLSVLAGYGFTCLQKRSYRFRVLGLALAILILSFFAYSSTSAVLFGTNPWENLTGEDVEVASFAGAREASLWIRDNTPEKAVFLTIGPSMANIIRFYSYRQAFALSVSSDAMRRNPAYASIINPDLALRNGFLNYVVIDKYSSQRTSHYAEMMENYVLTFNCTLVHETQASYSMMNRSQNNEVSVWIYQVSK